ncbi:MAG: response regulator [Proteobacteria bacterium]|nr:response regulator [Pseudomonadota bacterium]
MEKLKVLVVDDDPIVRDTLFELLTKVAGCDTETAETGKDGLEKIQNEQFNVVFTDLTMPEMNGIDLIKEVKKINPYLPIVVITGYGSIDNAVNAMKEGATDFITKPFTIDNIIEILNRIKTEPKLIREIGGQPDINLNFLNLALYKKYLSISRLQEVCVELDELYDNKKIYEKVVELGKKLLVTKGVGFLLLEKGDIKIRKSDGEVEKIFLTESNLYSEFLEKGQKVGVFKKSITNLRQICEYHEVLFAPLTINGEIFGGLVFANKTDGSGFNEEDFALAMTFAKKVSLRIENNALYEVFYNNLVNTLRSLVMSIEARDSYTKQHSERVTQYALQIAEIMNLSEDEIDVIRFGGYLHDIGKIGVKDTVLLKPGKLTDEEFEEIKQHSVIGDNILKPIKFFPKERDMIRHHHERYDGRGYPDGLAGEEIPITARILAVADTYDAMTSTRPYRKALEHNVAIEELIRCSGKQFDPIVVSAFLETETGKGNKYNDKNFISC